MKKRTKLSLVLSSLAAIAIAGATMAGGTYALFTSESKVNISVTSGTVKLEATVSDLVKSHKEWSNEDNGYKEVSGSLFGGDASLDTDNQTLTITKMVPMDKVSFNINLKNKSNVSIQYRTILKALDDSDLLDGLKVTIDNESFDGDTIRSNYTKWDDTTENNKTIAVTLEMPEETDNDYQDLSGNISFAVEAIQGNAQTDLYVTPSNVQSYLDGEHGSINGKNIILTEGEYGTLHFRQSKYESTLFGSKAALESQNYAPSRGYFTASSGYMMFAGSDSLTHIDATYMRTLKDVTIIGQSDAKVDNIEFMDGTYEYSANDTDGVSGNNFYEQYTETTIGPSVGKYCLRSYFTINNLTLKNITFTGSKTALSLAQHGSDVFKAGHDRISVDGLHFVSCTMDGNGVENANGTDEKGAVKQRKLLYTFKSSTTGLGENDDPFKNISIKNCKVSNVERVLLLDGVENLKVYGNEFKNISDRTFNGAQSNIYKPLSGKVVISNNTLDNISERFIRLGTSFSASSLQIKNNKVTTYNSSDNDYIKIEGSATNVVYKGNTIVDNNNSSEGYYALICGTKC